MTVIDILRDVYALLDMDISALTTAEKNTAVCAINHTLEDMGTKGTVTGLHETIKLSEALRTTLIYGTAMLVTCARGEATRSAYFTELYNSKRGAVLGKNCRRTDALPVCLP